MGDSQGPRSGSGNGDPRRLTTTVKWFNRTKGFGFVTPADGTGDVFLPAAVLGHAGHDEIAEGATIVCDVIQGPRGLAVAAILSVDETSAVPRAPRGGGYDRGPAGPTEELDGTVKWFDEVKGFGFISASDGGKDVFVHGTVLRRSGLGTLETGQLVKMQVKAAPRGREATSVELL
ncbi:MAG TPA: cold shock domain-containing protein [Aliidongia sp.]|uniref:cold-shock protein n=1 Tax=Aliidongia sp. TaxID=1914230 RepID=UPI002DDD440A|nr:cold shock domain-containing protein [Aliidongia sp.]HEV2672973.1 cold shock domain-containing protein [Aliidongia sp.]